MRRLLLLRHAKTERAAPGEHDRDRKLMERGRTDAPIIGAYLVRHRFVPDLALVSPATRAAETWALVAAVFPEIPPQVVSDERIYNAVPETLMGLIGETTQARSVIVVGHNPSLHDLALQLIASGDVEARERLSENLPTCGLVIIDFPFDDWSRLHVNAGRLERFVSPRLVAEATD
jgi:phosphohistidine phosphatase